MFFQDESVSKIFLFAIFTEKQLEHHKIKEYENNDADLLFLY